MISISIVGPYLERDRWVGWSVRTLISIGFCLVYEFCITLINLNIQINQKILILQIKMQQLFDFSTTWYFAFGAAEKTSLCSQYCRQNDFAHFKNPQLEELTKPIQRNAIIEGSVELFNQVEALKPQVSTIFFGSNITDPEEIRIKREYQQIGSCFEVINLQYDEFRKTLFPNLIFFYGPVQYQNEAASLTLAKTINYEYSVLPKDANHLVSFSKKSQNYVVNGFFTDANQTKILEKYFNIKIVHFRYNRIDVPNCDEFFDKEYQILPVLKTKPYYIPVNGTIDPVKIMDKVGTGICPSLVFVNSDSQQNQKYIKDYVQSTNGLLLNIGEIEATLARKKLPVPNSTESRVRCLSQIFYKDVTRKQLVLTGFPTDAGEFIYLENVNRRFSKFVDLTDLKNYQFSEPNKSQIYFLENQRLVRPNLDFPLADQLKEKAKFWVVGGASGSGKTTVAKFIADNFGFKLIEFEKDIGGVKEKLANPDEGEEVPLKKIINYYKKMIEGQKNCTFIFDSLPYENNDLKAWIQTIGAPSVLHLEVEEKEQIMRTRKKNEGDLAAEVNEQESGKAKENTQKAKNWLQTVREAAPSSRIDVLDYNKPQMLAQESLMNLLRPNIFLVQRNKHFSYQNIAVKYNLGYINLATHKLRECANDVKNINKANIILNCYSEQDQRLVSEDLYWIEKNLGNIRYLSVSETESKQIVSQKFTPQKPVKEEKPKAQGDEGGDAPSDPPPEGQVKKQFSIYDHEWSKPSPAKTLTQWFFKLKKDICQMKNDTNGCFSKFSQVYSGVCESNRNYYEVVQ